jgi:hypothetical protein
LQDKTFSSSPLQLRLLGTGFAAEQQHVTRHTENSTKKQQYLISVGVLKQKS